MKDGGVLRVRDAVTGLAELRRDRGLGAVGDLQPSPDDDLPLVSCPLVEAARVDGYDSRSQRGFGARASLGDTRSVVGSCPSLTLGHEGDRREPNLVAQQPHVSHA